MKQEQKISNGVKQLIATILIIGLVLSLNFNLFIFKPKQAQAFDVIGGPSQIANTVKDLLLDVIGHTIAQTVLSVLTQRIQDWGRGRKSDANIPFAVSDWAAYFREAAARGAAQYIAEFERTKIEPEIKKVLEDMGITAYGQDLVEYYQYAESTLQKDLGPDRYQRFKNSGYSLSAGGWDAWFSLMKPQNNIFGQVLMASNARRKYEQAQEKAADKEVIGGSIGYRNETITTKTDIEACTTNCLFSQAAAMTEEECRAKCEMRGSGIAIETRVKNWGSDIHSLMTKSLGADMDRLIGVDEITELLGVLFSAVINRAVTTGLGWASSTLKPNTPERTRAEIKSTYSYQRTFKKEQTIEDVKGVRSQTLTNILKSIQQLSRSITRCERSDEDKMVKYDDFVKNLDDIFSPSVESLYIGLEGVNLKPDFEVLDPRFAPYTVYGYSWGQVPANKFPTKCQKITDQLNLGTNATCRNIRSGLEPNYSAQCETCMYDHDALACPFAPIPPQPYPKSGQPDPWASETLMKRKADFYNSCRGWYLIGLDRCDECLKKADEKCGKLTDQEKRQCIIDTGICNNYGDLADHIVAPIINGLDFYNKCLVEEKKDACYTCLKEYFMPATYCEQVHDYTARALIKYPAVVKKVRNNAPDHEIWIGPYDKTFGEMMGGDCDNNDEAESIDLSLICRIMPDFQYNNQQVCRTGCSGVIEDQLRDITDFRPNGKDCANLKLSIGGKEPWAPIADGVFHTRGKCCGALWQSDKKAYTICVGSGTTTAPAATCGYGLPVDQEAWCYCPESWRPLAFWPRTGEPKTTGDRGGDCQGIGFDNPKQQVMVYTGNKADGGWDAYFIATGNCSETDERVNNTDPKDPGYTDGITDAKKPSGIQWSTQPGGKTCWLINLAQGNYYYGVYHNDNNDVKSAAHICAKCEEPCDGEPGDSGCPYYGTQINQCFNKEPSLQWMDPPEEACEK